MRVALICPYSLSRPGGVQGQVLGLARELRAIGIDARITDRRRNPASCRPAGRVAGR
jgi:hypothetical protein